MFVGQRIEVADFEPSEPPESLMHFLVFSDGSFVVFSSPAQLRAKYPSFLVDTLESGEKHSQCTSYETNCAKVILPLLCWFFLLIGQSPEHFARLRSRLGFSRWR